MPRARKIYEFACEYCAVVVERSNCGGKAPRFCSKSCSNKWQHANGLRRTYCADKTIEEWRDMHRTEAEVINRKQRKEANDIAARAKAIEYKTNHPWRNKSLEVRLGPEKAAQVRQKIGRSLKGKKRNQITKTKMSASMRKRMQDKPETITSYGIRGWYKGFFFRSSYEYAFLKQIETEGVSIQSDVIVEPFQIPYVWCKKQHTYIPDFFVKSRNIVYEIKNSYAKKDPVVLTKAEAARSFLLEKGIKYQIVTEQELKTVHMHLNKKLLASDPYVFLLPEFKETVNVLGTMFSEQERFMKLLQEKRGFPQFPVDLSTKDGQKLVKDISHDCMHELFEAIHLLTDSKNHRQTIVGGFDREKFLEEVVDAVHYMIEICILTGITHDELYKAFMKKGTINFCRILSGY